jgi:enoyl-CoA hydratase
MEFIEYEVDSDVAVITLNRPEQSNAQHAPLLQELDGAWAAAAHDDNVRVIVLKANGKHFSAGHDLSVMPEEAGIDLKGKGLEALYNFERVHYIGYSRRWRDVPKPSIAAVQGACIAGGLMLCWPCDLIIAADDAFFSDPVVRMGIGGVEYHGHTWELGARKAKELLFTAGKINAEEAHRLGMVNRVVPRDSLVNEVMELAHEIAQHHPFALAQAKRAVNQTLDVMGQYAAMQTVFDIHTTCHGNAMTLTGWPALVGLKQMQASGRADGGSPSDTDQ